MQSKQGEISWLSLNYIVTCLQLMTTCETKQLHTTLKGKL